MKTRILGLFVIVFTILAVNKMLGITGDAMTVGLVVGAGLHVITSGGSK